MSEHKTIDERVAALPKLLREAERRVNAHVFKKPHDAALCSIPADRDRDVDLLLIEAAEAIEKLTAHECPTASDIEEASLRATKEYGW